MKNISRRAFIERTGWAVLALGTLSCMGKSNTAPTQPEKSPVSDPSGKELYITSAAWVPLSTDAVANHPEIYTHVNIPSVQITSEGRLQLDKWAFNVPKAQNGNNILLVQNFNGSEWDPSLVEALMKTEYSALKDDILKVTDGGYHLHLDIENMTSEQQKNYPNFIENVNNALGKQVDASLPIMARLGGQLYGMALVPTIQPFQVLPTDYF